MLLSIDDVHGNFHAGALGIGPHDGADLLGDTALAGRLRHIVFVSDYIYSDALAYGELTEAYRRGLAHIDRTLAAACDTVAEVSFGGRIVYKGEIPV